MADRVSALAGHYPTGHHGAPDSNGVTLQDMHGLVLQQVAVWPESIDAVGAELAQQLGIDAAPGPCTAAAGSGGAMLRIEPLKWWLFGAEAPALDAQQGVTLDLSHSRTHLRVAGANATDFLGRHFPIDFREASFPVGALASTMTHHVGVTIWHSADGYELFIPRGFALSLWEAFVESAAQFGLDIV